MANYTGIDLGTTHSAICTYNGSQIRIWKSPEMNDVTPSAIYIDRRGNKYVGQRAYNVAPRSPDNCVTLFKRFMGTSTPIELSAVNLTLTPEACSAEILKTLFGYLPEEIRSSPDIGTVITVPAAFNQMQKDATMKAAEMAGIGKVKLMQEPVAAVMSYMRVHNTDGIFLIYDFGGGTLDIAIAESIRGRVTLLAHGGIQMCGGRDFDRLLVDNLIRPWLHENFELPDDLSVNPTFKPLLRLAAWATERAKIELSAREETMISLNETETRTNDLNGNEIYLEIPLQRHTFDELIADQVNDTIAAARGTLLETGLTPNDLETIVWIGEPTHYKPLRDKVAFELGIKGDTLAVNPMTAVAEGASIFAESIDWSTQGRSGEISGEKDLSRRRYQMFKTYASMDLLQNSFYILNVTHRDNRQRIMEIAEERSLLSDGDACMTARAELTNPRKRISAEMAWLPGVDPDRAYDMLMLLESSEGNQFFSNEPTSITPVDSLAAALSRLRSPYTKTHNVADEVLALLKPSGSVSIKTGNLIEVGKFLGIDELNPIARANLLAARMSRLPDYTPDVVAEWISAITEAFEAVNPAEVCAILNVDRGVSNFPEITDLLVIETEIRNRRLYYQQVIKSALENILTAKARVRAVTTILLKIESTTESGENRWSILIEDTVDSYEVGAQAFLETVENNIERLNKKLRTAAEEEKADTDFAPIVDELIQVVKDWNTIALPIRLKKKKQGLRHDASHDVADRVRQLAIHLFNEYDKLDSSQQILKACQEVFIEVPEIVEPITADLEILKKIADRREHQNEPLFFDKPL